MATRSTIRCAFAAGKPTRNADIECTSRREQDIHTVGIVSTEQCSQIFQDRARYSSKKKFPQCVVVNNRMKKFVELLV